MNHTIKISWNNLRKLVDCLDQHNIKFDTDFLIQVEYGGSMYQLDQIIKQTGGIVKITEECKDNLTPEKVDTQTFWAWTTPNTNIPNVGNQNQTP